MPSHTEEERDKNRTREAVASTGPGTGSRGADISKALSFIGDKIMDVSRATGPKGPTGVPAPGAAREVLGAQGVPLVIPEALPTEAIPDSVGVDQGGVRQKVSPRPAPDLATRIAKISAGAPLRRGSFQYEGVIDSILGPAKPRAVEAVPTDEGAGGDFLTAVKAHNVGLDVSEYKRRVASGETLPAERAVPGFALSAGAGDSIGKSLLKATSKRLATKEAGVRRREAIDLKKIGSQEGIAERKLKGAEAVSIKKALATGKPDNKWSESRKKAWALTTSSPEWALASDDQRLSMLAKDRFFADVSEKGKAAVKKFTKGDTRKIGDTTYEKFGDGPKDWKVVS